ncbi:MAG TPA: hypothetical protein VIX37_22965 [Candidatus Sulfotelmatobacter sp.]
MTPVYAPAAYVAGPVTLQAGVVSSLLDLIQVQLQTNCAGTCVEFMLQADPTNSSAISVGAANSLNGPLTSTNYGYKLAPGSAPRIYRSTYPGASAPLGELQVLSIASAILHVEAIF